MAKEHMKRCLAIISHEGNANPSQNGLSLYATRVTIEKTKTQLKITSVREDVKKREPHTLLVGMQNGRAAVEKLWQFLQRLKKRVTQQSPSQLYPGEMKTCQHKNVHMSVPGSRVTGIVNATI